MKAVYRSASAERGALVSLWGLLGLFLIKGAVGVLTGSKALLADACHTAADCASSATSYVGRRKAKLNPAATGNPHSSAETTVAIVLSALLLVAGIEIGISSARSVANGVDKAPGWGTVVVIVVGMGAREGFVRYKRRQEALSGIRVERISENRSDIFASLAALVGSGGALAGDVFEMPFLYVLDPAAGLVVSVFVIRMGFRLTAGILKAPNGSVLDEVDARMLLEAAQTIDGVVAVEDLRAKELGHYIVVDVVIRVNPRVSVNEGHDIALRVKRHLTKRFLHVSDVNVNVQPYDPGYPYKTNHQEEEMSTLLQ
jgi:cation diffusion facilitator family transporter